MLSFLRAPSIVWGAVVAVLTLVLLGPKAPVLVRGASVAVIVVLLFECLAPGVSWSPYYKVTTKSDGDFTRVDVNGVPHQGVMPVAQRVEIDPHYLIPYERIGDNSLENVLIIGAGTGTDVALALTKGAEHIDAVEIDPRIYEIGKEKNPSDTGEQTRPHRAGSRSA